MTKKVLFVGDAVVSSGFARCTHAVCDYLHSTGEYEVNVLGINYYGDKTNYPYYIYPCVQPLDNGKDAFGVTRLPVMIDRLQPDIVIILQDPWNIPDYFIQLDWYNGQRKKSGLSPLTIPPIIGWLAVDSKNQLGHYLNRLSHLATWTDFADSELKLGGYKGESSIVTLGVDRSIYYPRDKVESRKLTCPQEIDNRPFDNENAFIVGYVGRNQLRKRIDLLIQYFAEWVEKYKIDNSYLYLHVAPTNDRGGCDIVRVAKYYNLLNRVIVSTPEIGFGNDEDYLAQLYSSFDVFATCSQAEGFCLPVLESMACGVPTLVSSWAGLGERGWTRDASVQVNCTSTMLTAPVDQNLYTIGGIADRRTFVEELNGLYLSDIHRETCRRRGLKLAEKLSWLETGKQMKDVVDKVLSSQQKITDNSNVKVENEKVENDIVVEGVAV